MKYAWSVPEVMQVSQMDCGPSCLKSVLQGFNIPVHFGRLREACQTGVDGTSVDTIEELACELGLVAQQVLVPLNQLHLPEANTTPSILISLLPNSLTHFIVVWRSFGPWVQVMDPTHGRHWMRWENLKQKVYLHRTSLEKATWETWAASDEYRLVLTRRLNDLGFTAAAILQQCAIAYKDINSDANNAAVETVGAESWLVIASLDAVTTWTESLLQAGALKKGNEATTFFQAQLTRAIASSQPWVDVVPRQYWWTIQDEADADSLKVEAAVLVRIEGVAEKTITDDLSERKLTNPRINELEPGPWTALYKILLPQQRKLFYWLMPVIAVASATVALQGLLFQGLLGMSGLLGQQQQFNSFIPMLFLFVVLSALMELPIAQVSLKLGRQLESQFRIALFNKIPKIHDPYFRSRLLTDMARRAHKLYVLRSMPSFAVAILQQVSLIAFTLIGILWLDVIAGLIACVLVGLLVSASIFWQKILRDSLARAETQASVISMLYFDTLKGLRVIRSHSAQATFESEQEIQLSRWGRTHYEYQRKKTGALLLLDLCAILFIAALMLSTTRGVDAIAPNVLWFYWILRLPYLVNRLSLLIMDLPQYGIILSVYAELLEATEVEQVQTLPLEQGDSSIREVAAAVANDEENRCTENTACTSTTTPGAAIELVDVSLRVAGHWVLSGINLNIAAGQHIAIVGESGAGKSSICELLLGWQAPTSGQITVDNKVLQGETLLQLRQETAWVDANVQLWDRSLLDNLNYDHANGKLSDAGLGHVLAGLPQGLQTTLGESGKRLSGGEGQRVRIARALGVDKPRLVILDEPCRGLDRVAREQLLKKIRSTHARATLICITHDISEALKFSHVVVVGQGTILEQGEPLALLAQPGSALAHLRECEKQVLRTLLQERSWQALQLRNGQLQHGATAMHQQPATSVDSICIEEGANA